MKNSHKRSKVMKKIEAAPSHCNPFGTRKILIDELEDVSSEIIEEAKKFIIKRIQEYKACREALSYHERMGGFAECSVCGKDPAGHWWHDRKTTCLEIVELSEKDQLLFAEALINPPPANEALKKATERRYRMFRETDFEGSVLCGGKK